MRGMTELPDMLGWIAEEAEKWLHAQGWKVTWKKSGPLPSEEKELTGGWRVIRQRILFPSEVELTVAWFTTDYLKKIS